MTAIRIAIASDLNAIQRCAEAAYQKYVSRIGRAPAPMVTDFENLISKGFVHVATDEENNLAGYIVFYPKDDSIHLENVAVSPDHQGQGVGKRLIVYCERQARGAGFTTVDLYTNEKMLENLSLYPALGYAETGRREEDGFRRVYFQKQL